MVFAIFAPFVTLSMRTFFFGGFFLFSVSYLIPLPNPPLEPDMEYRLWWPYWMLQFTPDNFGDFCNSRSFIDTPNLRRLNITVTVSSIHYPVPSSI